MPLYEYECNACAHRFERIQKYSDPLVDVCPKCGGTVRKLLSSPAIQFKGSGFYITDYPKQGKGGGGGGDSSSSKAESGDKKGDKKSEGSEKSEKSDKSEKSEKSESSSKSSDSSESKPATPAKGNSES